MASPPASGSATASQTPDRKASFIERIVHLVETPLAFLCLVTLVIDGAFGVAGLIAGNPVMQYGSVIILGVMVVGVMVISVCWPDALYGPRPLRQQFANNLAASIFRALEGPIANQSMPEQVEAYSDLLIAVEKTFQGEYRATGEFRRFLSAGLLDEIHASSKPLAAEVRAEVARARTQIELFGGP